MMSGLPRAAMAGSASFAPASASFLKRGSGLISLFSGMKPETIVPGAIVTGNGRAAIASAPRWRTSAGMASRFASVALRSVAFWSERVVSVMVHVAVIAGRRQSRRTRNPDASALLATGFRVRTFGAPRNDGWSAEPQKPWEADPGNLQK